MKKIAEILETLQEGIGNLFESEQYKKWLHVMMTFHSYSLNNSILISMQRPDASLVKGYTAWQKLGRYVKKGEKGITILAPVRYKKDTGKEKDPEDAEETVITAFRPVCVFDLSQTEGKDLPSIGVDELKDSNIDCSRLLGRLKAICPVPLSFEEIPTGEKGYYSPAKKRIVVKKGMSETQTVKTLIHEMTHQRLHSEQSDKLRNEMEVEAESVAYAVCSYFDIDTSDYSFAYLAGWSSGRDMKELKASLTVIQKTTGEMIQDIKGTSCLDE